MKIWSKHRFGFVNIDDDFVYLTNSGNWSEVQKLKEKHADQPEASKLQSTLMNSLYVSLFLVLLVFVALKGQVVFAIVIASIFGVYTLYQSLTRAYRGKYKIPKSKVEKVVVSNDDVHLSFLDAHGNVSEIILRKITDECREALLSI